MLRKKGLYVSNTTKDQLTKSIIKANENRVTDNSSFDIYRELENVLQEVGLSAKDSGGNITFYGEDPIVPSTLRLASAAAIALVAKSVAVSKIWRIRGGKGQDIHMDLRKAIRRLSPFYDKKWQKLNGYAPSKANDPYNPLGFRFYQTKDDKWVMPLNPYPRSKHETLKLLNCIEDPDAVAKAIHEWNVKELEKAAAERGVIMPVVRTIDEFMKEPTYEEVAQLPLIEIEKIGKSEPIPFSRNPKLPPIVVVNDYVVSWLLEVGALMALERRAKEGGSYRVRVSLDRVSLWILSMGIYDKAYAHRTAGSLEKHEYIAPNLFTAQTPLGLYQGLTEQIEMSETPGEYKTVLVPRGSSRPEWL
jgi:crotonobetainyl-CoA:carnitine CoA-transferase CaiB-like acyl-CoA transferase